MGRPTTPAARGGSVSSEKRHRTSRNKATKSKKEIGDESIKDAPEKEFWTQAIPPHILQQLGVSEEEFRATREFNALKPDEKVRAARAVVTETVINSDMSPDVRFAFALAESESLLPGYATLDDLHRNDIRRLIQRITSYLRDTTRKRPFNALMLAAPGAGKSHFIKQLANSMRSERVQAVTFNMATMQSPDDIAQPIDELRNLKVNDRFPLLFLDEFDSDPSHYAALLP